MNPQKSSPSTNLSNDIFDTLKKRVIHWEYAPGHRFTEEGLCEEFGVSRSPVREALRMLVENHLVDKTPHKGYSVKQPDFTEIHELYDVRLALESFVVERLVERGFPEEAWAAQVEIWQSTEQAPLGDEVDLARLDEQFHEALASWTGNMTLLQQIRAIDERLHFIRMTDITTADRLQATCRQHLRLLAALKSRDMAAAQSAIRANIENGREHVELAIKEALARAYLGRRAGQ